MAHPKSLWFKNSATLRALQLGPNDEALLQKICSSPHANIALAKTFFIFRSIFLVKVNVFTGSSRNRARQPLKTVCVNYSAQHFVTTSRSVDGRRDGTGPKALIAVAQKNAIMRAVV